jgi:hypothetical protein
VGGDFFVRAVLDADDSEGVVGEDGLVVWGQGLLGWCVQGAGEEKEQREKLVQSGPPVVRCFEGVSCWFLKAIDRDQLQRTATADPFGDQNRRTGNGKCYGGGKSNRRFSAALRNDNQKAERQRQQRDKREKERFGLIAGDGGVDGAGPGVDAAGEGLGVLEALITQPHRDAEGTGSVMAEDDDWGVGVEFGVGARGDLTHGDEGGVGEVGGLVLPGLAHVQQEWGVGLLAEGGKGFCGNFGL